MSANRLGQLQGQWTAGDGWNVDWSRGAVLLTPTTQQGRSVTGHLMPVDPIKDPEIWITVEIDAPSSYRVTRLELLGPNVTGAMLRRLPVLELATAVIAHGALVPVPGSPGQWQQPEELGGDHRARTFATLTDERRRRPRGRAGGITAADVERVARHYRAAIERGERAPTETVVRETGIPRTTVSRHLKQARESGILPPTSRGKKKA